MKTNAEALKALYVKRGGSLTDTYPGIADGAAVGNLNLVSDLIEACAQIAVGSELPAVTAADNGKVLIVADGEWTAGSVGG